MSEWVISHEQCPKCAKLGKDNGHDNLAVYSDGHVWCFSCNYYRSGDKTTSYYKRHTTVQEHPQPQWNGLRLPADCDSRIPTQAAQWLGQYEIPQATLVKNNILWSESRQFLIFPYFIEGVLVGWQGRYFGEEKIGKWHTKGKPEDFIYTLGRSTGQQIVLVESIVSAIKVSRHQCCSPLFGSNVSVSRFIRLSKFYKKVVLWLDPDKKKEALSFAQRGKTLGLECQVIWTEKKPKDYTYEEIQEYLNDTTRSGITQHPT